MIPMPVEVSGTFSKSSAALENTRYYRRVTKNTECYISLYPGISPIRIVAIEIHIME